MLLGTTALIGCQATTTQGPSAGIPSASAGPTAAGASVEGPSPVGSAPPLVVLGTENFYADLLSQIGGARVKVSSLLNDPNADPHAFESSAEDAANVADAQLVIVNGIGYDDFMEKLLNASPNATRIVINVQQLLGIADGANAHIWYDPGTMPKVAAAATTDLAKLDPANAAYFSACEQKYLAAFGPVTAEIAKLKAADSGTPVAFTEPVAGYLAAAIGLEVLTPEGFQKSIEDGTDPAPGDVAAEEDLLTGKKVRVLFYNSQVVSPITSSIHDLAVANGIPVVGVAETIPAAYSTFQAWQLAQLDALEQALAHG